MSKGVKMPNKEGLNGNSFAIIILYIIVAYLVLLTIAQNEFLEIIYTDIKASSAARTIFTNEIYD